jgi:S-adenosyl-L-methionine hydrolase (adenosine-forming)
VRHITLLTDFGTADGYVAAMKGVIASIAPKAAVQDATHDIPPGDVHAAAWALGAYWRRYPEGTIHLAVVDPGVGTERRPVAVRADGRLLVGPDNGIFTRVLQEAAAAAVVGIEAADVMGAIVSATFHGRDIFAPAAAHLAADFAFTSLGPPVQDVVLLPVAGIRARGSVIDGEVVHVDRFGNLVTNIPAALVPAGARVRLGDRCCEVRRTYGEAAPGELLAVVGSRGVLEVSVRDGSAAEILQAGWGAAFTVDGGAAG